MTQDIIQQTFEGHDVRIVVEEETPWFVAKDVATVLGYRLPLKAVSDHVDDEDKGVSEMDTPGGKQQITTINESGLYSLVLSSKMPGAKKFKRWITSEVLPSIRKHGAYMTDQTIERTLTDPDYLIRLATAMKEERTKRLEAERVIEEQKPKVLFADAVSASHTDILIGDLAKILRGNGVDIGQKRLFAWMREKGYLIKASRSDYNMPSQKAMDLKLFRIKETAITHADGHVTISKTVKVTPKGQQYFVQKFLARTDAQEAVS